MIEEILAEANEKMEKAIAVAKEDFSTLRAGRASAALCAPTACTAARSSAEKA